MEDPVDYRTVSLVHSAGSAYVIKLATSEEINPEHSHVLNVPHTTSNQDVQIAFNYHRPKLEPGESKDWQELEQFLPSHRRHKT